MLRKFLQLLPTFVLDKLYEAILAELVKRGDIIFSDDLNNNDYN